jgi:AcrR family transcriptional regulator
MVDTPWGPSETLRMKKLRPGPGRDREEVERNQRERLFGAMVASVAERGYAATRIEDLVEISGVSPTTFYRLFPDKEGCFLAVTEQMLSVVLEATKMELPGPWEGKVRAALGAFAALVIAQPAAARMLLVESFAAGPAVADAIYDAASRLHDRTLEMLSESPERAEIPREAATALVGAVQELGRSRIRRGRPTELTGLMETVAEVAFAFRSPVEPLRYAERTPPPVTEALDGWSPLDRVVRGLAVVSAERGYPQTTVEEVVKRAAMSPTTFYGNFADKLDALLFALDSGGAQMVAATLPAFERNPNWPAAVRNAFGDLLGFLAARPALARLVMVEAYAGGPDAVQRRTEALAPLSLLVADATLRGSKLPPGATEVLWVSVLAMIEHRIRESGAESLPSLAPACTFVVLAPAVGAKIATESANSERSRPRTARSPVADALLDEPAGRVLTALGLARLTAEEIAAELDAPLEEVETEIGRLRSAGLIEATERTSPDPPAAVAYRAVDDGVVSERTWGEMTHDERRRMSAMFFRHLEGDARRAMATGSIDRRLSLVMARMPLVLDEEGWDEVAELMNASLHRVIEASGRSRERLRESDAEAIKALGGLLFFEMPADDG